VVDESAWGAVSELLPIRFPRPLPEPGVRVSTHRALHDLMPAGDVHAAVVAHGVGMLAAR
jgi:hypothetical protein